jgi:acyl-CoA synthetase (AMP-forming)/AMP-acid ligase II
VLELQPENDFLNPYILLEEWAGRTPDSPALIYPGVALSFSQLHSAVEALSLRFADRGVSAGKVIYTLLPPQLDWVATLALMRIGAVSMSARGIKSPSHVSEIFDFEITSESELSEESSKVTRIGISNQDLILDPEIEMISEAAIFEDRTTVRLGYVHQGAEDVQIARYSLASIGHRVESLNQVAKAEGMELNLSSLDCWSGLTSAIWQLKHGRPLITLGPRRGDYLSGISKLPITSLSGSLIEVAQFLLEIYGESMSLYCLAEVRVHSPQPAPEFFAFIKENFQADVIRLFGTNQTGFAFHSRWSEKSAPNELGSLIEGVRARVRNDEGQPTIPGDVGYLEIKSPSAVKSTLSPTKPINGFDHADYYSTGYAVKFQNGRYFLVANGPTWDNICSAGISRKEIEDFVRALEGVEDAALVYSHGAHGEPVLALAVSCSEEMGLQEIFESVVQEFSEVPVSKVARVRFIARDFQGEATYQPLSDYIASQLKEHRDS